MGWRLIAAMASTVLAVPAIAVPSASATAAQPEEVPCPVAGIDPPPDRPIPPESPQHGPGDRELGGEALATAGLATPEDAPDPPGADLSATSWLVADLDSGAVLGGCGPHEYGIPASTQKLLLAAAVMPELDPDQEVTITRKDLDFEPGSSAVGLVLDGGYEVRNLWFGLLLNSGNDAANVLARLGGGEDGVKGGLRAMNEEARRLGGFQTHAATPSGLDGPGQFTSAYDLALIARALFDRADFLKYTQAESATMPAQREQGVGSYQIQNQNDLLFNYPGALGGKTGFTDLARHSFVGAAEQDGRRLVVTLLGAEIDPHPGWQQAAALLDWGFSLPADTSVGRLVGPDEVAAVASSTTAPTAPPAAAGSGAAGTTTAPDASPVSAGTVGTTLFALGVVGLVVVALASRQRKPKPRGFGRTR